MYHHHHQHHSHHHQPTQLSYLPGTGLQYAYNNYCMMPPVYSSLNSLVAAQAAQAGHPTTVLPAPSSGPVVGEDARDSRDSSVLVTSSSAGLSLPDSNQSLVEVEAGEDRTDYMEELTRERESLDQGETNHARRLLDRGELLLGPGELKLTSSHYRDLTAPVRADPGSDQLRGPDGGRLQGEADQAGGEGDSSREGTSEGNKRTFFCWQKIIRISLSLLRFRDSMLGSLYIKIYFLRETKKMISYCII